MRTLAIICLLLTAPASAYAQACGYSSPPYPPYGCQHPHAICICDASGNCSWTFICG